MRETLRGVDGDCLERSCARGANSIRFGAGAHGVERAEMRFSTHAFEPHRHDTYAIGISLTGVLRFRYRGSSRICLPGQIHVLHPDVLHDGGPGTSEGFSYRILYAEPALVRDALGGGELPFVADPVQNSTPATRLLASLLSDIDEPITDLSRVDIATIIADALRSLSGARARQTSVDFRAVSGVRDYLAAHPAMQTPASTLERLTGLDRFSIARQFRKAFGTSPDRYRTMRRLELARSAIENGVPLAQAAAQAGFADQSHMTRQFKQTYGLTPARWANTVVRGDEPIGGTRGAR
jgi:AraC-like DNA-binding protein